MRELTKPVVVVGYPRSGTSMLTEMLMALGVRMGDQFSKEHEKINPRGFWEDLDFLVFNRYMCYETLKDPDNQFKQLLERKKIKAKNTGIPWGFKFPPILEFMPFYLKHLDADYIFCLRDKETVIKSWLNSFNNSENPMWDEYFVRGQLRKYDRGMDDIVKAGCNYIEFQFNDILYKPKEIMDILIDYLDIEPDRKQQKKAMSIVNPKISRFHDTGN